MWTAIENSAEAGTPRDTFQSSRKQSPVNPSVLLYLSTIDSCSILLVLTRAWWATEKKHETGSFPVSDTTVHHSNMHGQHAYRGTLTFTYSTTTKTLTYTLCKYTNTYMNPVGWGSIVYCQAWDNMGFVLLQLWDWPLDSQHSAYTITVTVALYTKWQSWNKLFSDDTEK